MRPWLLTVLRCPACQRELTCPQAGNATDPVVRGSLDCGACGRSYPIDGGTPRLIVEEHPVARSFAFQWTRQLSGGFESDGRCFALDPTRVVDELVQRLPQGAPEPGSVIIDAGCGLGEKAALLAERYPDCQVIAFDLTPSVCSLGDRYAHLSNLHFVQADLNHSPLVPRLAHLVVSIGVIHHTPDPAQSFRDLTDLVLPGRGHLILWVYLDPEDDPARRRYYRRRDLMFLRLGPRLPLPLAYGLCFAYAWTFALPGYHVRRVLARLRSGRPPQDPYANMSVRQTVRSMAFVLFDDVTPRYQFRLRADDVATWFGEANLSLDDGYIGNGGLFVGHRDLPGSDANPNGLPVRRPVPSTVPAKAAVVSPTR